MATHSSILAGRIPWTKEPGGLQFMGVTKSQTRLSTAYTCGICTRWTLEASSLNTPQVTRQVFLISGIDGNHNTVCITGVFFEH